VLSFELNVCFMNCGKRCRVLEHLGKLKVIPVLSVDDQVEFDAVQPVLQVFDVLQVHKLTSGLHAMVVSQIIHIILSAYCFFRSLCMYVG